MKQQLLSILLLSVVCSIWTIVTIYVITSGVKISPFSEFTNICLAVASLILSSSGLFLSFDKLFEFFNLNQ